MRVCTETNRKWDRAFTVQSSTPKIISVTEGKTGMQLNMTTALTIARNKIDADLKHDMKMIHGKEACYVFHTLLTDIIKKSDPRYVIYHLQNKSLHIPIYLELESSWP